MIIRLSSSTAWLYGYTMPFSVLTYFTDDFHSSSNGLLEMSKLMLILSLAYGILCIPNSFMFEICLSAELLCLKIYYW